MLIKDFMTPTVVTIGEDRNILEAREMLLSNGILSLPVVDDMKRIRGMITVNDIARVAPADSTTLTKREINSLLAHFKVKDIMSRNVITVNADDSVESIAVHIYQKRMNAFPVVDENNRICGIIAQNDLLRAFVLALGLDRPCTRITVEDKDEIGVLADIAQIFKENQVNIISLFTHTGTTNGRAEIVVRAELDNHMDVIEKLRQAGYNVMDIMTIRGSN